MNSSNTIPINTDNRRERMRYLLRQLSIERLDRQDATELRQLLSEEYLNVGPDPRYRIVLVRLLEILDEYIAGKVNLMPEIHVNVSNVV